MHSQASAVSAADRVGLEPSCLAASLANASPQGPEEPLVYTQVSALLLRLQDPAPGTLQSNTRLHPREGPALPPSITAGRRFWALTPHRWGPSQPGVQAPSLRAARQGHRGHSHLPLASPWCLAPNRGTAPPGQLTRAPPQPPPLPSLEKTLRNTALPPQPLRTEWQRWGQVASVGSQAPPCSHAAQRSPRIPSPSAFRLQEPRAHLGERARSPPGVKGMAYFRHGFVSSYKRRLGSRVSSSHMVGLLGQLRPRVSPPLASQRAP